MTERTADNANIAWIDVETTGLSSEDDHLLEVACLITDSELNILDVTGYQSTIFYDKASVDILKSRTSDYVLDMHTKTGLWDRLLTGAAMEKVDEELLAYLAEYVPQAGEAWLGGNSIRLDRNFMEANLDNAFNHLYYRSVDVSSFAYVANNWYNVFYEKKYTHSAFEDITESIDELKFYRKTILK